MTFGANKEDSIILPIENQTLFSKFFFPGLALPRGAGDRLDRQQLLAARLPGQLPPGDEHVGHDGQGPAGGHPQGGGRGERGRVSAHGRGRGEGGSGEEAFYIFMLDFRLLWLP